MLFDFLLPVIAFITLFAVICIFMRKSKMTEHFDEMQLKTRGDAYKVTLFVMIFLNLCAGLCYATVDFDFSQYVDYPMASFTIMYIGIIVFAVYSIAHDAFFSVNDNGKTYIIVCIVILIANVAGLIPTITSGEFMSEGGLKLSQGGGNLMNTICFGIILVAILIKRAVSSKEDAE